MCFFIAKKTFFEFTKSQIGVFVVKLNLEKQFGRTELNKSVILIHVDKACTKQYLTCSEDYFDKFWQLI